MKIDAFTVKLRLEEGEASQRAFSVLKADL